MSIANCDICGNLIDLDGFVEGEGKALFYCGCGTVWMMGGGGFGDLFEIPPEYIDLKFDERTQKLYEQTLCCNFKGIFLNANRLKPELNLELLLKREKKNREIRKQKRKQERLIEIDAKIKSLNLEKQELLDGKV